MSTFTLKIIALVFMFIDHIGYYFTEMPILFRMIGRCSYPLFLFCMIWGYHYTKNRCTYLLRLYLLSVFMTVFRYLIERYFYTNSGYGNHNIFLSMFWVAFLISTIEIFIKDKKKGSILLALIAFVQIIYYVIPSIFPYLKNFSGELLTGIIPNLTMNEYGFEFVILGVLMYFLKEKKEWFIVVYILFCINQFNTEMISYGSAIQWIMIFALPLMLMYNNEKGIGMKYFFYVFYPVHTFILFYLANFVFISG